MIHEVLIAPGIGYCGTEDYDPGHMSGAVHEFSVLDSFVRDLCDHLDLGRIRHKVLPVMTSPGVPVAERASLFEPNQLVVNLRLGWERRGTAVPNWSSVAYGGGTSVRFAKIVTDAVGQWGRCYVHGHQTRNPVKNKREPLLNAPETAGMLVTPYAINGRQAIEYGRRLRALAESLAWAFSEYLGDDACTGKPGSGMHVPPSMEMKPSHSYTWTGLPEWVFKDPLD